MRLHSPISIRRPCGIGPLRADSLTPPLARAVSVVVTKLPRSTPPAVGSLACNRLARVEAVLLVAREPLSTRRIAELAMLDDATQARTLVTQLSQRYQRRGGGLVIEAVAGGYQLFSRPDLAPWLRKLGAISQTLELSPSALETLAVVAYRQPIIRAEIESIRGVACGELLRQLIDRDLLRIVGRCDELGRPMLYGTTKRFLQVFGLRDLEQLPRLASGGSGGAGSSPIRSVNEAATVVPAA